MGFSINQNNKYLTKYDPSKTATGTLTPNIQTSTTPQSTPTVPTVQTRPSAIQTFEVARETMGTTPQIKAPNVVGQTQQFTSQMPRIEGLGGDYFQRAREARKEDLRREFFGPLGVAQQAASGESAGGRLGSGVGQRILEETVTRPYMEGLMDIDRDIMQREAEERARVETVQAQQEQFKMGALQQAALADSTNAVQSQIASANIANTMNQLASQLAMGEAGLLSQEQMQDAQLKLNAMVSSLEANERANQMALEYTSMALNPSDWGADYISTLQEAGWPADQIRSKIEQLSDATPEFRETWENIYRINYGLGLDDPLERAMYR